MTVLVSAEFPLDAREREAFLRELLRKKTGIPGRTRATLVRELERLKVENAKR